MSFCLSAWWQRKVEPMLPTLSQSCSMNIWVVHTIEIWYLDWALSFRYVLNLQMQLTFSDCLDLAVDSSWSIGPSVPLHVTLLELPVPLSWQPPVWFSIFNSSNQCLSQVVLGLSNSPFIRVPIQGLFYNVLVIFCLPTTDIFFFYLNLYWFFVC